MKKLITTMMLLACCAYAQSTLKGNVFLGAQAVHAGGVTEGGFLGSFTADLMQPLGVTFQASAIKGTAGGTAYAILAGPVVHAPTEGRVTPFAQVLAGAAFASGGGSVTPSYFALSLGGGADVAITHGVSFRAGADWLHIPAFGASGARVYAGVVFKF